MARDTKIDYLEEHLPYELLMLRHTHSTLLQTQDVLNWNAFFECFVVHARNLYNFLRNKSDLNTFAAVDFTTRYRRPNAGEIARNPRLRLAFRRGPEGIMVELVQGHRRSAG